MPSAAGSEVYVVAAGCGEDAGAVPGTVNVGVTDAICDAEFTPPPDATTAVVLRFSAAGYIPVPLKDAVAYAMAVPAGPAIRVLFGLTAFTRLKVVVMVTSTRTPETVTM